MSINPRSHSGFGLVGVAILVASGVTALAQVRPPVIANAVIGYSAYGDPRLRRFTLTLRRPIRF